MAIQEWAAKSIRAAMNKGQQALSGGKNLIGNAVGDTLDVGKQLYNQVSFQPEVQPTQDQITVDFLRRLQDEGGAALQMARDVGGDALQRGGQIGGQALGLGGQALGGLLDIAKKPETWRTAADLMAIASAPYSPQLAETYSGISGRIGDRMEARDLVEREAAEAQAAAIKDQEKANKEEIKIIRNQENVLRKEFNKGSQEYQTAIVQNKKLTNALNRATPAGDLAAVFAYMKLLDPPSVVREGEQATAKNATGVPDRIRNLYNSMILGHKLTPAQRKDFKETSKGVMSPYIDRYTELTQQYIDIANRQGLNSLNIIGKEPESSNQRATQRAKKTGLL
tara:strand:+ start:2217 stop:3230 length:1014 start_codon:yes stop_codon:yes gene_type:complete